MTTSGGIRLPYKVWNDRAERFLQHMVISMVIDAEGKEPRPDTRNPKILKDRGRKDLKSFHDWGIFVKARDCGMDFPNTAQVERYLDKGMAKRRIKIYVVTGKEDKVRKGHPSHRRLPVGSVRTRGDNEGSKYIKTAQPDKWELIPKKERGTVGRVS